MSLFDKKYLKRIDWVTVGIVLALVVFGTIALASVQAKPFDGTEHGIADYMDKLNMEYLQKHITNFLADSASLPRQRLYPAISAASGRGFTQFFRCHIACKYIMLT